MIGEFRLESLPAPGFFRRARERAWREWCFVRVLAREFRLRLLIIFVIIVGGAALFHIVEGHPWPRAMFFTWSLVFGEPPEDFPAHPALQFLFFCVPVLGLIVILESIVDFALLIRDRRRQERSWCRMMSNSLKNHIVLVGLGKLGYRTYLLLRRLGEQVVVIERDPENQFLPAIRLDGSPVFIGDARREELLTEANIKHAKGIILASNDDLANLEAALDARRINPDIRVVLRMFDQNMADKIRDGFNIPVAMSQSAISAPAFATAAIESTIINSMVVEDRLIVMQHWYVRNNGPLANRTVGEITQQYRFGILQRRPRGGAAEFFPGPQVRLAPGDELIVQGAFEDLASLRKTTADMTLQGLTSP